MIELLVIILLILLIAGLPVWPYSRNYGAVPSGTIFIILIVLLIIYLL